MSLVSTILLMLSVGASLCLFFWAIKNTRNYIGFFFLLYAFLLCGFLFSESHIIAELFGQITWLLGPLIYFFARDNKKIEPIDLLHIIPFVVCITLSTFHVVLRIESVELFIIPLSIMRSIHSVVYLLLSALEVKNNHWMKGVIISMALLLATTYLFIFELFDLNLISSFVAIEIMGVGYLFIRFVKDSKVINLAEDQELENLNTLYKRILFILNEDQLYLNQNLKISDLTSILKVNDKQISRAINTFAQENFNAFINRYRVKHATFLINSEKYSYYTIDAIAEEVGFSNKVSFYKAFKRVEAISPSKYRQNAQKTAQQATG